MCLPYLCGGERRVANGLLPSSCRGSVRGVFEVWEEWGKIVVHVSCGCVDIPLRPVLIADCFYRSWIRSSCVLLGTLVVYVFCCFVYGVGECVLQCWCWYKYLW